MVALTRRRWSWQRFLLAPRSATQRYGVAVLLACASLSLVYVLPEAGSELSSLALFSVVLSALYGGLGPALLDTAITALGIDYFFAAPVRRVFDSWDSLLRILIFGLVGFLIADIVASLRDAYGRLRAEHREAELAKRAREDVLAMVSHDLRSPLSSILLSADDLGRMVERRPPEELRAAAQRIARSGRHMSRLIDDLLDAVKIEKGQFRIEPGAHDLAALAEEALHSVGAAAQAKGVRLQRLVPEGDYRLRCDGARVTQALSNLLGNAVKFSPEGAVVEIELQSRAAQLAVKVTDCGPGIAEQDLPLLFLRYGQAKATAYKGTGLGLFIAQSIAQAHGGHIAVVSRPGRGAAFTLTLPRNRC